MTQDSRTEARATRIRSRTRTPSSKDAMTTHEILPPPASTHQLLVDAAVGGFALTIRSGPSPAAQTATK